MQDKKYSGRDISNGELNSRGLRAGDLSYAACRSEISKPTDYRLVMTTAGIVSLQGYYTWSCGDMCGGEWRTMPTIIIDE